MSAPQTGGGTVAETLASVDNALRILHLLRRSGPLRISELAHELGIGVSTAHRLVSTLRAQRFVRKQPSGHKYELGPAMLFTAGASAIEHCVTTATPVMNRLRDAIEETVHLSSLRGTEVIFLASAEANRQIRVTTRVGQHPRAHVTAAGKVLLAALDPDQLRELYGDAPPALLAQSVETGTRSYLDELATVRTLGYARNLGESEPDMYTIAVPIRRPDGSVACALAISTLLSRAGVQDAGEAPGALRLSPTEQGYLESLTHAQGLIESLLSF